MGLFSRGWVYFLEDGFVLPQMGPIPTMAFLARMDHVKHRRILVKQAAVVFLLT
jgi:hypothetical protein